jgi:hypothetical protein
LTGIVIPSSVEYIGEACFSFCRSLISVTFESRSRLHEIGRNAFPPALLQGAVD